MGSFNPRHHPSLASKQHLLDRSNKIGFVFKVFKRDVVPLEMKTPVETTSDQRGGRILRKKCPKLEVFPLLMRTDALGGSLVLNYIKTLALLHFRFKKKNLNSNFSAALHTDIFSLLFFTP